MSTNPEGRYQLQSTSEGFQNKVKDVFANLDSIADKTEKKKAEENNKKTNDEKKREKPRHYQHPNSVKEVEVLHHVLKHYKTNLKDAKVFFVLLMNPVGHHPDPIKIVNVDLIVIVINTADVFPLKFLIT